MAAAPRADRVAIGPDDPGETIEDSDSSELIALQRKFESVGRGVAPAVVSISAAETASDVDATVRSDEMNPQRLQTLLDKTTRTIGTVTRASRWLRRCHVRTSKNVFRHTYV